MRHRSGTTFQNAIGDEWSEQEAAIITIVTQGRLRNPRARIY